MASCEHWFRILQPAGPLLAVPVRKRSLHGSGIDLEILQLL